MLVQTVVFIRWNTAERKTQWDSDFTMRSEAWYSKIGWGNSALSVAA
jgi:hypothetical protein